MRLALALAFAATSACAPVALSPAIIRIDPGEVGKTGALLGLRSGPYLSEPLSVGGGRANDANAFSLSQWAPASYDLSFSHPVNSIVALHAGAQGTFYYPFPLPGYGLFAGVSAFFQLGPLRLTPAIAGRGATDFGIKTINGPGSFAGGEATLSIAYAPEERIAVGIVPFWCGLEVWSDAGKNIAYYYGAVAVVRIRFGANVLEFAGGAGRAQLPGTTSSGWTVPILGVRGGR